MLDDETGKILGISCYSSKKNSLEEKNSVEGDGGLSYGLEAIQMTLLEYFSDYYQDVRYQDSYLPGDSDQDLQYMDIYPSGDAVRISVTTLCLRTVREVSMRFQCC